MTFDLRAHCDTVATAMKRRARLGTTDGRTTPENDRYLRACRRLDRATNTVLIFTRDVGHHASGWLRNPDYERCLHLSLSPAPSRLWTPSGRDLDRPTRDAWLAAFFGESVRLLWSESPKSPEGRAANVWHWRLFCDAHWQPILPRGEVYSLEFTEAGWRSWSEVIGARLVENAEP